MVIWDCVVTFLKSAIGFVVVLFVVALVNYSVEVRWERRLNRRWGKGVFKRN